MATAAQENAVATRQANPLVQFKEQLEARARELRMALPSHISEGKFQRTIITAAQQNPGLLTASRQSLVLACMKSAQDGLLPDGREAALVPFKTSKKVDGQWLSVEEVAYIPMAFGIRKKILQARDAEGKPVVSALQVGVVYRREVEEGHFLYEVGLTPPLRHRPMLDLTAEDTTDDKIVGAYSIAFMVDGQPSYEFMRRFEIDRVRESSQTGATKDRFGKPRTPKGPWVEHFSEMAKKTVLRRHSKTLPQSGDLILEADDDEFDAGVSSVAVLGSANEAEPVAIEDHSDDLPPHDPETGVIIEDVPVQTDDPKRVAAEKKLQKMQSEFAAATDDDAKAEIHDRYAKWISDLEGPFTDLHEKAMASIPPYEEQDVAEEEREPTPGEEAGMDLEATHNAQVKADSIIAEIKAANANIDVNSIVSRHGKDIAAMPEAYQEAIESAAAEQKVRIKAEQANTPEMAAAK